MISLQKIFWLFIKFIVLDFIWEIMNRLLSWVIWNLKKYCKVVYINRSSTKCLIKYPNLPKKITVCVFYYFKFDPKVTEALQKCHVSKSDQEPNGFWTDNLVTFAQPLEPQVYHPKTSHPIKNISEMVHNLHCPSPLWKNNSGQSIKYLH